MGDEIDSRINVRGHPGVRKVSINLIHENPKNPRVHSAEQIELLSGIMEYYGQTSPILVQKGTLIIVAGHARLAAAKKLGWEEIEIRELDFDDRDSIGYLLADNRIAEYSGTDISLTKENLIEIDDGNFNLELTGYSEQELKSMIEMEGNVPPPELQTGGKVSFREMTFVVTDEQAKAIEVAIKKAIKFGPIGETGNENKNGNALHRICEEYGFGG